MAKKRPAARAAPGKKKAAVQEKAPNPFELKGSKRKFNVLGRRVKGDKKSLVQARSDAVDKRKKTLLVEYKQLRKANTFIDRRFGEDDERLGEEERSLARFQTQRMKDARRGAKFALNDSLGAGGLGGEEEGLTHMGRSLEELEDLNEHPDALADLDDDVLEDMVKEYNFGGGGSEGDKAGNGERKTKRQVMEEIIQKSKAYKALKAQQKEADEKELEDLDAAFKELVAKAPAKGAKAGGLAALLKPPGFEKGERVKPDNEQDALYDRAARELVFEAKGQASERTLTADELAEKERARLELLERQRLERMRGNAGNDDDDEAGPAAAAGGAAGGYAARRKRQREGPDAEQRRSRRQSGDALDDDFASGSDESDEGEDGSEDGSGSDEDGVTALDQRRRDRAAGGHPLQAAFREQAARLAEKYGLKVADEEDEEEGDSEGDGDSSDEGEEEGAEEESGQEEGDGEQQEQEGDGDEDEEAEGVSASEDDEQQPEQELQGRRDSAARAETSGRVNGTTAAGSKRAGGQQAALEGPLDLPFTIPVPGSYPEFVRLVGGRPAADLKLAVQRIRAFNAASLATDNRRKLQVFYGILVQHFAMLAGQAPLPLDHLDTLLPLILELTQEVPYYAATVARARLANISDRLSVALSNPLAAPHHGWPGPRALLQLQLFLTLFPVTDKRHPVVTPAVLLLGRWLSHCPVVTPSDAALGLAVAGLALGAAAPANRFAPEPLNFLAATLEAFLPSKGKSGEDGAQGGSAGVSLFTPGVLALTKQNSRDGSSGKGSRGKQQDSNGSGLEAEELPRLPIQRVLSEAAAVAAHAEASKGSDVAAHASISTDGHGDDFKLALLGTALAAVQRAAELAAPLDAAAEVLAPLASAIDALLPAATQSSSNSSRRSSKAGGPALLPPAAIAALRHAQGAVAAVQAAAVARRLPLLRSGGRIAPPTVREYNPRYEADYVKGRDYDPDRERAAARNLQRQVVREKRGAMRELRRDAAFMAQERDRERAGVDAERLASQKRFYSELQNQEADFKSGGQGGMNPHLKKKKGRK